MKQVPFDAILDALPRLTKEQRGEIVKHCALLGATKQKADDGTLAPEEFLWRCLCDEMEKRNQMMLPSSMVSATPQWASFRLACKSLDTWVTKHFQPADQVERHRSFRIIANCIISVVESWGVAVTPRVLLKQARNATQSVDFVYPGYAASGLLRGWVLLAHS